MATILYLYFVSCNHISILKSMLEHWVTHSHTEFSLWYLPCHICVLQHIKKINMSYAFMSQLFSIRMVFLTGHCERNLLDKSIIDFWLYITLSQYITTFIARVHCNVMKVIFRGKLLLVCWPRLSTNSILIFKVLKFGKKIKVSFLSAIISCS